MTDQDKQIENKSNLGHPLSQALEEALTNSFLRYKDLVGGVDPETLLEPARSGVIYTNVVLKSIESSRNKSQYVDYNDLAREQTDYISNLVTSFPTWVPYLFESYFNNGPSKTDLEFYKLDFFETEEYFEHNGIHELILNLLEISKKALDYTTQEKVGDKEILALDIKKILGGEYDDYKNTQTLDDAVNILKKRVRNLVNLIRSR